MFAPKLYRNNCKDSGPAGPNEIAYILKIIIKEPANPEQIIEQIKGNFAGIVTPNIDGSVTPSRDDVPAEIAMLRFCFDLFRKT